MNPDRKYLHLCLDADKWALGKTRRRPRLVGDEVWKYQRALRWCEYYRRIGRKYSLGNIFWTYRHHRLGCRLGFDISVNAFGPGLRINHRGLLIVNTNARIGKWCDIHQGVNIGTNSRWVDGALTPGTPVIGDFCFIGPGAKLFGDINIGQRVRISANSVVNKSVEDDMVACGIPVKSHPVSNIPLRTIADPSVEKAFLDAHPQYRGML